MSTEFSPLAQSLGILTFLGRHVLLHVLALLIVYIFANEIVRSRRRIPGLKGPKGWPVIGNLRDVRVDAALKYRDWAKTYGDVFQVQMGNIPVVVANSPAAVKALWITNSQALSSRPQTYTFHKVSLPGRSRPFWLELMEIFRLLRVPAASLLGLRLTMNP